AQSPSHTNHTSPTLPPVTTTSILAVTPPKTTPIKHYTRRARIAQSSALLTVADEPASPLRDVIQVEACPTNFGFIADQDRATIAKSFTLPHDSAPMVTPPAAEVEINKLKERVKLLEDREGVAATRSGDDAPIKGRCMDEREAATKRISDDSEEMTTVLTSMDAATVLESGVVDVLTGYRSIPTANTPAEEQVPTGSDVVPTTSPVFATATVGVTTFSIPPGASDAPTSASIVLPGTSVDPAAASAIPADSPNVPSVVPADSPNMEEDRLGEEAAKRLHEAEMAQMERERAEAAQGEANASLSKTLLGDDVSEDNFPARMATLIKKKRQALAEQFQIHAFSRTLKRPGPVLEAPSSKRPKSPEAPTPSMLEVPISPVVTSPPSSRTQRKSLCRKHMHKPKSTLPKLDLDAPTQTFLKVVVIEDSNDEVWSAVVGWEVLPTPMGAINALYRIDGSTKHFATLHQILHMVDRQDLMKLYGLVVLPTPMGAINALYRIDGSTKHFATLHQILHMVDRQDLMKLYGLVVQYYETHPVAGAGLLFWGDFQILFDSQDLMKLYGLVVQYYETHPVAGAGLLFWGDLQILFDSQAGGKGSCVWKNQHLWEIRSWRLYTLSNIHVLETVYGEVLSMFTEVSYPLSVELMERMLMHKLEIDSDFVGNDLTTAEQLIQFIKNQLVASQASFV
nr:hypothetical protein [Tanacetum cinerariifolium]